MVIFTLFGFFFFQGLENLKDCSTFQLRWVSSFIISSGKTGGTSVIHLNVDGSKCPLPTAFYFHLHCQKRKLENLPFTQSLPITVWLEPTVLFTVYVSHFKSPRLQVRTPPRPFLPLSSPQGSPAMQFLQIFGALSACVYSNISKISHDPDFISKCSFHWEPGSLLRTTSLTSLPSGSSLSSLLPLLPGPGVKDIHPPAPPCPAQITCFPLHCNIPLWSQLASVFPIGADLYWPLGFPPLNLVSFTSSTLSLSPVLSPSHDFIHDGLNKYAQSWSF